MTPQRSQSVLTKNYTLHTLPSPATMLLTQSFLSLCQLCMSLRTLGPSGALLMGRGVTDGVCGVHLLFLQRMCKYKGSSISKSIHLGHRSEEAPESSHDGRVIPHDRPLDTPLCGVIMRMFPSATRGRISPPSQKKVFWMWWSCSQRCPFIFLWNLCGSWAHGG